MALYTSEQLERRNASRWTRVQVVLAPIQFLAFLISFGLVVRFLATGQGYAVANASVLVKIGLLWAITVTGMVWEKEVFGRYFLARAFLWEDLGNAVAMLTHNLYFVARAALVGSGDHAVDAAGLLQLPGELRAVRAAGHAGRAAEPAGESAPTRALATRVNYEL